MGKLTENVAAGKTSLWKNTLLKDSEIATLTKAETIKFLEAVAEHSPDYSASRCQTFWTIPARNNSGRVPYAELTCPDWLIGTNDMTADC